MRKQAEELRGALRARGRGPRAPFGWRGWVLATVGTLASIAFLGAFRLTYVANVALIYAMTPFAADCPFSTCPVPTRGALAGQPPFRNSRRLVPGTTAARWL